MVEKQFINASESGSIASRTFTDNTENLNIAFGFDGQFNGFNQVNWHLSLTHSLENSQADGPPDTNFDQLFARLSGSS